MPSRRETILRHLSRALLIPGLMALGAAQAQAQTRPQPQVLRAVLNTELQVLDPIVTTTNAARVFAYMVFDTLVSLDSHGGYRPQMLEGWQVSEDRLTWTFRLRDGLEFHDGTPVTAEDCVASIRRWAARDSFGTQLMRATTEMRVVDSKSFEIRLSRPFAFVVEALGRPGNQIPVMMPARLASLPASAPVPEVMGSGPFTFRRGEWRPGERAIFDRNPRYRPRTEPADALAGGKVVRFDRVELISIPDAATRLSALQTGEVDFLEIVPGDFIPALLRDRNITVSRPQGTDQIMSILQINHAQPPFNNLLLRRAAQQAIRQSEVMASLGLPENLTLPWCGSIYMCNAPGSTDAGTEALREPSLERARALLKEAGYNNEPLVFLHAQDSVTLNPTALVMADQLRKAGFNVDLRTSDYATVAQRRLNTNPVDQGGWSAAAVIWNGIDLINPIGNFGTGNNCVPGYPGSYCDPKMTELLRRYSEAPTPEEQRDLAGQIQAEFHSHVNVIFGGQFSAASAHRANLKGLVPFAIPVFWNVERQ
ncbi:ABC transporter substrate-binding protein [Roseomonas populi]|uniref:ABC transporter substrate-binding protein n=1 Tax=Roseomonas populi TaxID=3121582 RepID=A0ABT1X6L7_9PROT|nr:ABC transporter substrate-binding protein [Roseomonas pecuniae]MCR0983750.1 ABC transporter substrate-binding protein [Roseomonas pecuniae]